jgi:hypothetical protein
MSRSKNKNDTYRRDAREMDMPEPSAPVLNTAADIAQAAVVAKAAHVPEPRPYEPFNVVKEGRPAMNELGDTGLSRWGGQAYDEFLAEMRGDRGRKVIEEMRQNSPVIAAMLRAIEWLCRGVTWTPNPDKGTPKQQEFLTQCLQDMSFDFQDTLSEILTFLPFGFAYFEIVYKFRRGNGKTTSRYDDGLVGWRKWAIRGQNSLDHWEFDKDGGIAGMWQRRQDGNVVLIPIEKALLFRTSTEKNNPEGKSLLRACFRSWWMVKNMEEIEGVGVERDLTGLPIAYLGNGCTTTGTNSDLAIMKKIVRDVHRDEQEGIVIPKPKLGADGKGILFELLTSGGRRQFDIGAIITRYEKRMAMTLLAQWLMLGMDQVGAYALSRDQSDFFRQAIEAILKIVQSTINRYAIPRLFDLNPTLAGPDGELPELTYSLPIKPEYGTYAAAVNQLVQAQVLDPSDEGLRASARDILGLPEKEETPEEMQQEPNTEGETVPSEQPTPEDEKASQQAVEEATQLTPAAAVQPESRPARKSILARARDWIVGVDKAEPLPEFTDEDRAFAADVLKRAEALKKDASRGAD